MALILGIDPGSRVTGYGVINAVGNRLEYVACGCIRLPDADHPQRLKQIFDSLCQVIEEHAPQECAIEEVFLGKSVSSALKLGQARGAAFVNYFPRYTNLAYPFWFTIAFPLSI